MRTPLVRGGVDAYLLPLPPSARGDSPNPWVPDRSVWPGAHTFIAVHAEMLLQIMMDYASLPDPRTLRAREVRFLYNGLRATLHKRTGAG